VLHKILSLSTGDMRATVASSGPIRDWLLDIQKCSDSDIEKHLVSRNQHPGWQILPMASIPTHCYEFIILCNYGVVLIG